MKPYEMKKTRELCWDMELVNRSENVALKMHKAQIKNRAFTCDAPWEGNTSGYPQVMKIGDTYRLYYRGSMTEAIRGEYYCVAESKDGKTFTRKPINIYECKGYKENNVVYSEQRFIDNFSIHYDENPNCPADEKFKALSLFFPEDYSSTTLYYYKSSDGYSFEFVRALPVPGVFDTLNVVFWNKDTEEYYMYVRDFHDEDGNRSLYDANTAMERATRDVRLTKSKDFVNWTEPQPIEYIDNDYDYQMYTNQIQKYKRGNMYIGMPTRYIDRRDDVKGLRALPGWNGRRAELLDKQDREGSALTDCALMVSRDGFTWKRDTNAFLTPPLEYETDWVYGDGYVSHGLIETACDDDPTNTELSFVSGHKYRFNPVEFWRYAIRLDGFYSWRADSTGGKIYTKPLTFEGNNLHINFKTSIFGHISIQLCEITGVPIEGYYSEKLFGNSTDRVVEFDKPLSELKGKPVVLKIDMKDADLYSFVFED